MNEALLKRIDSKLTHMISKPKKEKQTWVKASVITSLTGWDKEAMRRARNYGYVKHDKREDGIWYELESVNPQFIKK